MLCAASAGLQVDCEQTSANQGLAQSSGISAFPTFHLYRQACARSMAVAPLVPLLPVAAYECPGRLGAGLARS